MTQPSTTPDPAVEPTPEQWVDEFLALDRVQQEAWASSALDLSRRGSRCWTVNHDAAIAHQQRWLRNAETDLDATRAEVAALRSVVARAQALADAQLVAHSGHTSELCDGGPSWRECWARDLHEALALVPVASSEETGERAQRCGADDEAELDALASDLAHAAHDLGVPFALGFRDQLAGALLAAGWSRDRKALLDWSTDAEDCSACAALADVCPYHQGEVAGIDWVAQQLGRIAEDPERLNLLAERRPTAVLHTQVADRG